MQPLRKTLARSSLSFRHDNFLLSSSVTWWGSVIFLLGLSRMVSVDFLHQLASSCLLEQVYNSIIDGISIFVQPTSDIVGNSTSVVNAGKVSILI